MRSIKFALVALSLLALLFPVKSQDLHYSQHVYNPLYYNPAFTGFIPQRARVMLNYSDRYRQSLGDEGLRTVFGSADVNLPVGGKYDNNKFIGIGGYFYNHKRGNDAVVDNVAALSIAYRMWLDESMQHSISAGFNVSFWNRNYNYSNLQFGNQFDGIMYNPSISSGEGSSFDPVNVVDGGLGVLYSYDSKSKFRGYVGASVFHLIPDALRREEIDLALRYNVHGGADISFGNLSLLPSLMIDYQRDAIELYTGAMLKYLIKEKGSSPITFLAGPYLRAFKGPVGGLRMYTVNAMAGVQLEEFQVLVSFDNTISSSSVVFGGFNGFEISFEYNFGEALSNRGKRIYCPAWR
jgi:type IX secretion system PorP/SprF family membrane protein